MRLDREERVEVRILQDFVSMKDGSLHKGDIVPVPVSRARLFVKLGYAVAVHSLAAWIEKPPAPARSTSWQEKPPKPAKAGKPKSKKQVSKPPPLEPVGQDEETDELKSIFEED